MEIINFKLKSKTNSNVFVVTTSEGEFILHSEIIVKLGITKGIVNDNVFFDAVRESEKLIALNVAMKYISSKIKSTKQIVDYLYKKEFHKVAVDYVVNKLTEYGVLNDKYFVTSYINSNKNWSKNKLKQKLFEVGIKKDLVDENLIDFDDYTGCKKSAEKFVRNKNLKEIREKLVRHLAGKGYNFETINRVLKDLKCEGEDDWNWYGKNKSVWTLERKRV